MGAKLCGVCDDKDQIINAGLVKEEKEQVTEELVSDIRTDDTDVRDEEELVDTNSQIGANPYEDKAVCVIEEGTGTPPEVLRHAVVEKHIIKTAPPGPETSAAHPVSHAGPVPKENHFTMVDDAEAGAKACALRVEKDTTTNDYIAKVEVHRKGEVACVKEEDNHGAEDYETFGNPHEENDGGDKERTYTNPSASKLDVIDDDVNVKHREEELLSATASPDALLFTKETPPTKDKVFDKKSAETGDLSESMKNINNQLGDFDFSYFKQAIYSLHGEIAQQTSSPNDIVKSESAWHRRCQEMGLQVKLQYPSNPKQFQNDKEYSLTVPTPAAIHQSLFIASCQKDYPCIQRQDGRQVVSDVVHCLPHGSSFSGGTVQLTFPLTSVCNAEEVQDISLMCSETDLEEKTDWRKATHSWKVEIRDGKMYMEVQLYNFSLLCAVGNAPLYHIRIYGNPHAKDSEPSTTVTVSISEDEKKSPPPRAGLLLFDDAVFLARLPLDVVCHSDRCRLANTPKHQDFDRLVTEAHERNMKLIMDFIPNHSSDLHPWFQESKKGGAENKCSDYYVWHDGKLDEQGKRIPPNNWVSTFGGSAWTWMEERQQFYFHQYHAGQPDLNWRNPAIHAEILKVFEFWLDRGVDGFRIDTIGTLYETENVFLDNPRSYKEGALPNEFAYLIPKYSKHQPETLETTKEWRQFFDEYEKRTGRHHIYMVVELYDPTMTHSIKFYDAGTDGPFNFNLVYLNRDNLSGTAIHRIVNEWLTKMPAGKWPNWVLGNHDRSRLARNVGGEYVDVMTLLLLLLPGTPTIFQGDEIGMTNVDVTWEQTQDPWGLFLGKDLYKQFSRDPARAPVLWSSQRNASFSEADETWLPVHPNYEKQNIEIQRKTESCTLQMLRQSLKLREEASFQRGSMFFSVVDDDIFSFVRHLEGSTAYLVALNVGKKVRSIDFGEQGMLGQVVLVSCNVDGDFSVGEMIDMKNVTLKPGDGIVMINYEKLRRKREGKVTFNLIGEKCWLEAVVEVYQRNESIFRHTINECLSPLEDCQLHCPKFKNDGDRMYPNIPMQTPLRNQQARDGNPNENTSSQASSHVSPQDSSDGSNAAANSPGFAPDSAQEHLPLVSSTASTLTLIPPKTPGDLNYPLPLLPVDGGARYKGVPQHVSYHHHIHAGRDTAEAPHCQPAIQRQFPDVIIAIISEYLDPDEAYRNRFAEELCVTDHLQASEAEQSKGKSATKHLLKKWIEKQGRNAELQTIIDVLVKLDRNDIVHTIKDRQK